MKAAGWLVASRHGALAECPSSACLRGHSGPGHGVCAVPNGDNIRLFRATFYIETLISLLVIVVRAQNLRTIRTSILLPVIEAIYAGFSLTGRARSLHIPSPRSAAMPSPAACAFEDPLFQCARGAA